MEINPIGLMHAQQQTLIPPKWCEKAKHAFVEDLGTLHAVDD